jgi:thioredoxin-like negative regulator of GroEL
MDLENERRAVKPQKSAKAHARANENTGKASQMMAGFFQEMVMEEVLRDVEGTTQEKVHCGDREHKEDFNANTLASQPEIDVALKQEEEEAVDDLEIIRQRRMQELMKQSNNKNKFLALGHGRYTEIAETEFLKTVTDSPRALVHIYHSQFKRCKVMDEHLGRLAPVMLGCRIVKMNAEKAPFFVGKLKVKVLPTVVMFVNGVAKSRVVGFEGLMEGDDNETFTTAAFARLLEAENMLVDSDEAAVNRVAEEGDVVRKEAVGDDEDEEW